MRLHFPALRLRLAAGVVTVFSLAGVASAQSTTYSGRAVAIYVNTLLTGPITITDTGALPAAGGSLSQTLASATVPGVVQARLLSATTNGGSQQAASHASVSSVTALPGNVAQISASVITSDTQVACDSSAAKSQIASLTFGGHAVRVTGAPNQTISLLGLFKLVINEQISVVNGTHRAVQANALHLTGPGVEVIIAGAESDINCVNTPPPPHDSCSGILFFGPDVTKEIYSYVQTTDPGLAAEIDNVVTSNAAYQPDLLSHTLDAKLARDGVPYCAILFDSEFYGPNGTFTGLSPLDEARLKSELLAGTGFVYTEPTDLGLSGGTPSTPHGQIPDVLPVKPYYYSDHTLTYNVTDLASPLAAGLPHNPFVAASSGQDNEIDIEPAVAGVSYSNVVAVANSVSGSNPNGYIGTGGTTIWTLDYGSNGSHVAIIGTDPYADNVATTDFATINRIYYNAIKYAAHL